MSGLGFGVNGSELNGEPSTDSIPLSNSGFVDPVTDGSIVDLLASSNFSVLLFSDDEDIEIEEGGRNLTCEFDDEEIANGMNERWRFVL